MNDLKKEIKKLEEKFQQDIQQAKTVADLENIKIEYLGKKGIFTNLMKQFAKADIETKRELGPTINEQKKAFAEKLKNLKEKYISQQLQQEENKKRNFDLTAYEPKLREGHLHPYSQFVEEIENILISMGYEILNGPEVETDFYNFEALNFPPNHPARDMQDTFWLEKKDYLLRTHTSPMQIRAMQQKKPPIAAIVPGRTYRHEATDASHDTMFMQCEGFLIDKNITLSNLFATAKTFLSKLFEAKNLDIRVRPGYFPFVEPGVEIDMRCPFCKEGCSVCKKSKWIEVFPGGLIHPNVLKAGGLDPNKYSGFAFGFGLTRLLMLRHGINDIRLLYGGKVKFLEQF